MTSRQRYIQKTNPVRWAARRFLEEADGNWEGAHFLLMKDIESNPDFYKDWVKVMIDQCAWEAVRFASSDTRGTKYLGPQADPNTPDDNEGIMAMGRRTLYDWPLMGGKKLGDATRPEVTKMMNYHHQLSDTNGRRGRFFSLVVQELHNDDVTVRTQITIGTLTDMAEKCDV